MSRLLKAIAPLSVALMPLPALAAPPAIDTGDTSWMLVSTALVLLMTIRVWVCSMRAWFARKTSSQR